MLNIIVIILTNIKITFEKMVACLAKKIQYTRKNLQLSVSVILKWMAFGTFIPSTVFKVVIQRV